jgi:uncharacterized lipoprotein YmbA
MCAAAAAAAAVWLTGCAGGWQQNRTLLGALQVQQQHPKDIELSGCNSWSLSKSSTGEQAINIIL